MTRAIKILVMGLPGSGKTTLASCLVDILSMRTTVQWINADAVRAASNDWDFSVPGRIRQSVRFTELAKVTEYEYVIFDMVAPLPEMRVILDPDVIIWVDTIQQSRYSDTNSMFVPPIRWDFRVDTQDAQIWASHITSLLL